MLSVLISRGISTTMQRHFLRRPTSQGPSVSNKMRLKPNPFHEADVLQKTANTQMSLTIIPRRQRQTHLSNGSTDPNLLPTSLPTAFHRPPACRAYRTTHALFNSNTFICPRGRDLYTKSLPMLRPSFWRLPPTRRMQKTPMVAMALSPKLEEDVLLQFQTSSGVRRLALAVKPDGKRNWIVNDANGVSHSISGKQVTFVLGDSARIAGADLPQKLQGLDEECAQRAEENRELLQLVWETVLHDGGIDGGKLTSVSAVADIIFGDADALSLYTTHLLLSDDLLLFKERNIKGQVLYEARTEEQVGNAQLMLKAENARREESEQRRSAFLKALEGRSLDPLRECLQPGDLDILIDCLKQLAAELDGSGKAESLNSDNAYKRLEQKSRLLVSEAFSAIGMKIRSSTAMEMLVSWGVYSRHENLALKNAAIPHLTDFDAQCLHCVEQLLSQQPPDVDQANRRDLTHLSSYAVDSADTTEVDDAIAWDPENSRVYVHIADPTRYFPDGLSSPLLQSAFRRVSTLYLPETKLTMFPQEVTTALFSLDGLESNVCALSFGFRIKEDGSLDEEFTTIEPTLISPPIRITYDKAEEILGSNSEHDQHAHLQTLYHKAHVRQDWREIEGGALIIKNSFGDVSVTAAIEDEPELCIREVDTNTKSWLLVSELMITACAIAADYAGNVGIVMPFRGQDPFDYPEDEVLESVPNGPARAALAFRNATPSVLSTTPIEHASLGLDAYVQVTSPIRRSLDLVAHFQLKAQLRGEECPFSVNGVRAEIGRSNDISRTLRVIENRSKKYWQVEYLRRAGPSHAYDVQLVRKLKDGEAKLAIVNFEGFGFQMVCSVPTDAKPGTILTAKVVEANPRTGVTRIEAMHKFDKKDGEEYLAILDATFSDVSSQSDLQ